MRLPALFVILAATVVLAGMSGAVHTTPTATIFAPGAIAGTASDGAAAFTPDRATVVFMRDTGNG